MKINQLYLKNITSYREETLINFDQINHDNLFIIAGETGSGKSTILNSITFALFGKCHQANINHADLISLGKSNGSIKLLFEYEENFYSAEVSIILKSKTGKSLKSPRVSRQIHQRELKSLNSSILNTHETLSDIIHLNYDQFNNSVILNQGKFNQFLFSSFSKRKEILENFYHSFNLQKISQNLFLEVKLLKEQYNGIDAQITSFKHHLAQFPPDLPKLISKQENILSKKSSLIQSREDARGHLHQIISYSTKLNYSSEKRFQNQKESADINASLSLKTEKYKLLKQEFISLNSSLEKERDQCLKGIEEEKYLIKLKSQINNIKQSIKGYQAELSQKRARNAHSIIQRLEQRQYYRNLTEELKISPRHQHLHSLITQESFISHIKHLTNLSQDLWYEQKDYDVSRKQYYGLKSKITQGQNKKNAIEQENAFVIFEKLEQELSHSIRQQASYSAEQKELNNKLREFSSMQKRRDLLYQKIIPLLKPNSSINNYQELNSHFNQYLIDSLKENIKQESIKQGKCLICHTWISHDQNHTIDQNQQGKNRTPACLTHLDILQDNIKKIGELENELGKQSQYQEHRQTIQHKLKANQQLINKIESQLTLGRKFKVDHQALCLMIESDQTKLKSINSSLQSKHESLQIKESQILSFIDKHNYRFLYHSGLLAYFSFSIGILEKMAKMKESQQLQKIQFQENKEAIVNLKQKKQIQKQNLMKQNTIYLPKAQSFQKKFNQASPTLRLQEIQDLKDSYVTKLDQSKQSINVQEKQLLLLNSNLDLLNSNIKDFEKLIYHHANEFNQSFGQKINLNEIPLTAKKIEYFQKLLLLITSSLEKSRSMVSLAEKEYGSLVEKEKQRLKLIKDINAKQKELKSLHQEKSEFEDLQLILGKDQFRNFVLSKIESNLIAFTNRELIKLAGGRYQLKQNINKYNQSEYYIIDRASESLERKINTLSGGEVFIVSLCMAFALSELNRGKVKVETLFIDEGFGHLDSDNLLDVINHLKNLKRLGTNIGIISHITELKNMISSGLLIQKRDQESSIVSYL